VGWVEDRLLELYLVREKVLSWRIPNAAEVDSFTMLRGKYSTMGRGGSGYDLIIRPV